jgi:hypothetical protein
MDRLFLHNEPQIKQRIMAKAHQTKYSVHPKSTKMYMDLRKTFWWNGMRKDIASFVAHCLTCQQIKAEHQRLAGLLQPLQILEWK